MKYYVKTECIFGIPEVKISKNAFTRNLITSSYTIITKSNSKYI